ncbi:winged helix-turn-helix domain-containing protein [Bradyrhizobium sp. DOA1]|uniref:ATP-binding protein n=1 Tax=Bradyrhizobium sp. DOA1 TaxID=1126616 RepID=UPI00077C603F|nr:winged helix-turn-helix domain-containing protein [Bradyrhizobium sp. DOA1]KYG98510.1 hypothetical protein SE91_08295 [Bradyrhizobium sp. DOA1]
MVNSPSTFDSADADIFFGRFQLKPSRRQLLKDGVEVRVGSRDLDILITLINRAGEIVSQRDLLKTVWREVSVDEASLRVHVATLRRTLGDGRDGARYIINVSGRGYSFVASIERKHHGQASPKMRISAPKPGRQLPSAPRLLVGRDATIESLSTRLMSRRFVSIVGAGGIGKTTVAAALVRRLQAEFGDDEVVFVDLGAITDPKLVPGAVISAIECSRGGTDPIAELLSFLADKRILLLLDSCEHLLEVVSALASQIFEEAPGVHLLVTSREALRVAGETVYLLGPLAYPECDPPSVADAIATPAVTLFLHRASFSGFEGPLSDEDAMIATEICRRTDGIALAIELVASRVGTYGIRGVAGLLANEMELSLDGRRNATPRHRTLQATLDWSFRLLEETERRVLSYLSRFVGLFTLDAACFVAEVGQPSDVDIAAIVARLVDKSLIWVHPIGDEVFYRLPDTTRVYAVAKLEAIGEARVIADRHALYFATAFQALALKHGAYTDIARHAPHIGNVRKALEWSFARGSLATGIELAADAAPLFLGLWLLMECRDWSHRALKALEDFDELSHREARLQEAYAVSSMHTLGNTPEVQNAIQRGLELHQAGKETLPQLRLLAGLNLFLTRLGDFEGAFAVAKRCRAVAGHGVALSERVIAEWMVAAACHLAGDQSAALKHCENGFELERSIGRLQINLFGYDHHLRAEIARARCLWLLGSPEEACVRASDEMNEAACLHPISNYCMAVIHSIPVMLWNDNTEGVLEHVDRAIAQSEKHALQGLAAAAHALRGEWLAMTGKPAAGVEELRRALRSLYREQLHMVIPPTERALADGLARSGRLDEARAAIKSAVSTAVRMRQTFWLPDLLRTQAEIYLMGPNADCAAAQVALRQSMDHAKYHHAHGWELKAAVSLAKLLDSLGLGTEARALVLPAFKAHSHKSGSPALLKARNILSATS